MTRQYDHFMQVADLMSASVMDKVSGWLDRLRESTALLPQAIQWADEVGLPELATAWRTAEKSPPDKVYVEAVRAALYHAFDPLLGMRLGQVLPRATAEAEGKQP